MNGSSSTLPHAHDDATQPRPDAGPSRARSRGIAVLAPLDEDQRAAAQHAQGPSLVLGGPGTGKTRVLAHQIAWLVATGRVSPRRLLVLAPTEAAAEAVRARAERLVGAPLHGAWIGTIRNACHRILQAHAAALGRKSTFTILEEADARQLIRRVAREVGIDLDANPPVRIQEAIAAVKTSPEGAPQPEVVRRILPAYEAALADANAFDRDDLVRHVTRLLLEDASLRRKYRRRFEQILVDDFQDTSAHERQLLLVLAGPDGNAHVAAGPDTALRPPCAPEPPDVTSFTQDFPGARTFVLPRNYRSSGRIVHVTNRIAARNPPPHALAERVRRRGARVVAITTGDELEEAALVVRWIERLWSKGETALGRIAILVRQPAQFRPFEEMLVRQGLPYRVASGPRFWERREIKDVLAYLRLCVGGGSIRALARISNAPRRGIGPASVRTIDRLQRKHAVRMAEAALMAASLPRVTAQRAGALADLGRLLRDLGEAAHRLGAAELIDYVVERSGYGTMLTDLSNAEEEMRREGIDELRGIARVIPGLATEALPSLLACVALVGGAPWVAEDQDEDERASRAYWAGAPHGSAGRRGGGGQTPPSKDDDLGVQLLTYQDARGTEFDVVFVNGLEEGILPSRRAIRAAEPGIQVDRRLAVLAMSRARDRLVLLRALRRTVQGEVRHGDPSRFLLEAGRRVRHYRLGSARPSFVPPPPDGGQEARPKQRAPSVLPIVHEGQRVAHPAYGRGTVVVVEEGSGRTMVRVRFDEAGEKRLALDLARLTPA